MSIRVTVPDTSYFLRAVAACAAGISLAVVLQPLTAAAIWRADVDRAWMSLPVPTAWVALDEQRMDWSAETGIVSTTVSYRTGDASSAIRAFADRLHGADGWYVAGGSPDLSRALLRNGRSFLLMETTEREGVVRLTLSRH